MARRTPPHIPTASRPTSPEALWLSVSPSFRRLEREFLMTLNQERTLARWEYQQTPDEPSSLDVALTLLHDYVKGCDRPLHLAGHGTGGLVGLLYARQHPERVKSLSLLGIGVNPAIDWKAHYYQQLGRSPYRRRRVLLKMVYRLFGEQCQPCTEALLQRLERDLMESLSLHSPLKPASMLPGGAPVPLLVGGGQADDVVEPMQIQGWLPWLKECDRLWFCPQGRHCFHVSHPQSVAAEVAEFWDTVDAAEMLLNCLESA